MTIYTRNTSIYYSYSKKKKFFAPYGITVTTNYYQQLRRSRYLFFKSKLLHIYFLKPLIKDRFDFFIKDTPSKLNYSKLFLKIINIYN